MNATDHEEIENVASTSAPATGTAGNAGRPVSHLGEIIETEIGRWPGVTKRSHRFGGVEFRYGRVELGHLHGGHLADLPMPRTVRDELVAAGRALPHHALPDSGWVSRPIRGRQDAEDVIELFRLSYDRVRARKAGAGKTPERQTD